jgi:phosphatidylinositol glycan class T
MVRTIANKRTYFYLETSQLFPRSLANIVDKYSVQQFQLSLTQGRWFTEAWGDLISDSSPVGAELYAEFLNSNESHQKRWTALTNSFSGIFCSSLVELSTSGHALPKTTPTIFRRGTHNQINNVVYGILPREGVCTENYTPWIKLFPCSMRAGISLYFRPTEMYGLLYHSMITRYIRQSNNPPYAIVEGTVNMVLDLEMISKSPSDQRMLNLKQILQSPASNIATACPLTTKPTEIHLLPSRSLNLSKWVWNIETSNNSSSSPWTSSMGPTGENYHLLTLTNSQKLSPAISLVSLLPSPHYTASPLWAPPGHDLITSHYYLTGYGQETGGLAIDVRNGDPRRPAHLTVLHIVPWYLRVFFHTLTVSLVDEEKKKNVFGEPQTKLFLSSASHPELWQKFFHSWQFSPGKQWEGERGLRKSEAHALELNFTLLPLQRVIFHLQFEKTFLHYTEHPPDAHRGFDLPSVAIRLHADSSRNQRSVIMYTEPLLIMLPTPDFSMPYNVITLTGTVFALCLGTVFNLFVRRMKNLKVVNGEFVSNRPVARIIGALFSVIEE